MDEQRIRSVASVVSRIESRLAEDPDLDTLAEAAGYSKYHLHRMFTGTAGLPLGSYIRRRQLTEAARLLVFSRRPIVDVALSSGYGSQQAFTAAFRAMYKQTPLEYRRRGVFYPLQLPLALLPRCGGMGEVSRARPADLPGWMDFLPHVVGGFPCLNEAAHAEQVRRHIRGGQALVARDGDRVVGAAAFSRDDGHIGFLAVHPQYRGSGVGRALLDAVLREGLGGREISITTFRRGDRADPGQREAYRRLGFTGAELLTEFGYPVQRLVLAREGAGRG